MKIQIFTRDQAEEMLSKNFKAGEFFCRCGQCKNQLIDLDHIARLQDYREILGVPLRINCGFRCEKHNAEVNPNAAFTTEQHPKGSATDVSSEKSIDEMIKIAELCNFKGIGRYNTFVHVDSRQGDKARWRM